jgi:hypothetical protein
MSGEFGRHQVGGTAAVSVKGDRQLGRPRSLAVVPVVVEVGKKAGLGRRPSDQLPDDSVRCRSVVLERLRQETEVVDRVLGDADDRESKVLADRGGDRLGPMPEEFRTSAATV